MDLEAQIARVAVLRTESRAAAGEQRRAAQAAMEANAKYEEADEALRKEIRSRIDKLDPIGE